MTSSEMPTAQPSDVATRCCRTCADWLWRPDVAQTANGPLSVCITSKDGDYRCPRWREEEVKRG